MNRVVFLSVALLSFACLEEEKPGAPLERWGTRVGIMHQPLDLELDETQNPRIVLQVGGEAVVAPIVGGEVLGFFPEESLIFDVATRDELRKSGRDENSADYFTVKIVQDEGEPPLLFKDAPEALVRMTLDARDPCTTGDFHSEPTAIDLRVAARNDIGDQTQLTPPGDDHLVEIGWLKIGLELGELFCAIAQAH